MIHLNENGVNVFINRYSTVVNKAYWNNYDLIIWKNHNGFFNINGLFNKAWE